MTTCICIYMYNASEIEQGGSCFPYHITSSNSMKIESDRVIDAQLCLVCSAVQFVIGGVWEATN